MLPDLFCAGLRYAENTRLFNSLIQFKLGISARILFVSLI